MNHDGVIMMPVHYICIQYLTAKRSDIIRVRSTPKRSSYIFFLLTPSSGASELSWKGRQATSGRYMHTRVCGKVSVCVHESVSEYKTEL